MLSGDIHLNPGPVRYPCTVCYRPVKLNERALSCDVCQRWTHCRCSGVSVVDYQRLQGLDQFTWMCPSCYANSLPFADCSVLSSVDTSSSDGLSVISDSSVASALFIPKDYDRCNLRMAHLNCRSLLAHLEDILALASDGCIDVFALSETWLDETVSDTELCPRDCGFSIVRNDRNRRGGGVAFLLANHVRYVTRPDLCSGGIETLWLQLFPGSTRSLLVCCAYRSPSCMAFYDHLSEECELSLSGRVHKLCILGDFNSDLLQPALPHTKLLIQLMKHFNFRELVGRPTRITSSSCSQLDILMTNVFEDFCDSEVIPCSCSDHHLIYSHYYARGIKLINTPNVVTFRSYRRLDIDLLSRMLSDNSSWSDVFSITDVDDCVLCFTLVLQGLLDILVPLRRLRIREGGRNPWLTAPDIVSARHLHDKLHRKALRTGCSGDWSAYRRFRNHYTSLLRSAKRSYILRLISDKKIQPAKLWKHFNFLSKRGVRQRPPIELSVTSDDFNAHFLSVPHKTISMLPASDVSPLSFCGSSCVSLMEFTDVTVDEVATILVSLDSRKAKGVDGIPAQFLKASPFGVAGLIAPLLNRCLSSSVFPTLWKCAVVSPVQKSSQSCELTNFRPISVLPIFSKLLERIVYNQLV